MARSKNITVQNNFSKGLITEATGLTFPENACTDTDNCVFNHFGLSSRRLGFDLESQYETFTQSLLGNVTVSYLWNNVAGEGDISYVVVQIGDVLHFYLVSADNPLSGSKHANTINLSTFMPAGVTSVSNLECQFSSGNGLLFVTNERLDSFYVEYNTSTDTFSGTEINLQIRDFEGDTADVLAVDSRPTSTLAGLTSAHRYNLENQGWTTTNLTAWDTAQTTMPSNADVMWSFKNATDDLTYDAAALARVTSGNTQAPKGHFIYNIYNILRSSNVSGATDYTITFDRVNTSAFFAGRVFYAGLRGQNQSSRIYFSQIAEYKAQYGKCYQTNDPTSENFFDLLPSDGGVIDISDAGTILKMIPVQNFLVVFASNGIWAITGSQGSGFTANDYSVYKISSVTNISHTSFVLVEGIPFWWNLEGIYTIKIDSQTNSLRVESVTDNTIRTFITDIPGECKQFARGVYDQYTKSIQWIYKSRLSTSFNDKYCFDRMLTLDLLSGAFYPWSVSDTNICINSITNIFGFSGVFENVNVIDGANTVVDSGDQVIAFVATSTGTVSVIKYLVSYTSGVNPVISFAECYKDTYLDWESFDAVGEAYSSYFITGYAIRGQAARKFQQNYVYIYSDTEEGDTSYKIRGRWDYATSAASGQWSTIQLMNVTGSNHQYLLKRIKLRGHGKACQFQILSNGNEPFNIIGWSAVETANEWI